MKTYVASSAVSNKNQIGLEGMDGDRGLQVSSPSVQLEDAQLNEFDWFFYEVTLFLFFHIVVVQVLPKLLVCVGMGIRLSWLFFYLRSIDYHSFFRLK